MSTKHSADKWKVKAIERRIANKELQKRRKELKASRENWKNKYKHQKERADGFEQELRRLKKKLKDLILH